MTACGPLTIWTYAGKVVMCNWSAADSDPTKKRILKSLQTSLARLENGETSRTLIKQLDEYFDGKRKEFDVPTLLIGSDFQKAAWASLTKIPYGETISYKEEAERIGAPNAWRAIGNANRSNPLAIIRPCHRVVGTNGEIGGYSGGKEAKRFLLELERRNSIG